MMKHSTPTSKQLADRKRINFNRRSGPLSEQNTKSPNYADLIWLVNKRDFEGVIKIIDKLIAEKKTIFKIDLDIALNAAQEIGDCATLKRIMEVCRSACDIPN